MGTNIPPGDEDEWKQRTPPDDPSKHGRALQQELARLRGETYNGKSYPGVREQDEDDIEYYLLTIEDRTKSNRKNHLTHLRVFSQFVDRPIRDHDAKELNTLLKKLERKRGWQTEPPSSRSNYATSIAAMLRAHGDDEVADGIIVPRIKAKDVDPKEVIDWSTEVMPMIEECNNARDRALIATLWEASNRVGAHAGLKIRHYEPFDEYALLTVPDVTGDKDAGGDVKPLILSRGYVDKWLADHPCPDDPEAALFTKIRAPQGDDEPGDHIGPQRIYDLMKEVAERAGIENLKRVKPHQLRHSRATYMRKSERYGKDDIEAVMDWKETTEQHSRYENAEKIDDAHRILRKHGIKTEETEMDPIEVECPRCDMVNPAEARYCLRCSLRLDDSPADWFVLFKKILSNPADDPVAAKYEDITSATPEYESLPKSEFEHVDSIFYDIMHGFEYSLVNDPDFADWYEDYDLDALSAEDGEHIKERYFGNSTLRFENYAKNRTEYDLTANDVEDLEEYAREHGFLNEEK